MKIVASGWSSPIGWCNEMNFSMKEFTTEDGRKLTWMTHEIEEIVLSRAAALLLIQGLPLQRLFPPDVRFIPVDATEHVPNEKPFLLLKATPPNPLEVPPKIRGVVLGVVLNEEGLSEEEIRGAMVAEVLNT